MDKPKIVVSKDGPYIVSGQVPLAIQTITPNAQGESWEWVQGKTFESKETYELCRCGRSRHKPFCDGSHTTPHFHGAETATRAPFSDQAERIDGPAITLDDAQELCAFARFCDAGGKVWALVQSADAADKELAIREANHCPSGRLVVNHAESGRPIEHPLPPSIGIVEDPAMKCSGPLWVRGGIPIESADGTPYEPRNRVALCRCGASENKPFCNGGHASIKFKDGLT